ncbi:MAG: hypothetical protein J6Y92_02410 [Lentisphaeria bacterium]|nr:hypothetical protein [Lentisphaeria bacterium]
MEEFAMVLMGLFVLSSICGFLCAIALLILLFRIPNVSATDGPDELDNESGSPQDEQNLDTNWTVTRLLLLTALHAIVIPWVLILIKPLGQIFFIAYPAFEIIWYILFRKTLFAEEFRETLFFKPAKIICMIDLIPIALVAILMIPTILIWFFLLRHF